MIITVNICYYSYSKCYHHYKHSHIIHWYTYTHTYTTPHTQTKHMQSLHMEGLYSIRITHNIMMKNHCFSFCDLVILVIIKLWLKMSYTIFAGFNSSSVSLTITRRRYHYIINRHQVLKCWASIPLPAHGPKQTSQPSSRSSAYDDGQWRIWTQ